MQRYSPLTNSWSSAAPLPLPLNHANAAAINGKIYLLGGLTPAPSNDFWFASSACYVYTPETDTWTQLLDMPPGLQVGAAAVGVHGNTIYLAGGLTWLNLSTTYQPSVDLFTAWNVGTQVFTSLPALPAPRDHAGRGFISSTGTFYVIGGRAFGHDNVVNTTFAFSFQTREWKEMAPMLTARGGVASAVLDDHLIFVMGGEGNPDPGSRGVFKQNEAYDTMTDSWRVFQPMDVPRHGTCAAAIGEKIYIPGGGVSEEGDPTDYFSYFAVA
ncbi:hypothetical protein NHQ30_001820 [Ciborinia camelliae]|nr:hypothetical protein NHQ30_001820 [Ciborinia camelliae]